MKQTLVNLFSTHKEDFFLHLLSEIGVSQCTFSAYKSDLFLFLSWIVEQPTDNITSLYAYIKRYIMSIGNKCTASTLSRKISVLKSYYKFLATHKYIQYARCNWQHLLPKKVPPIPRILSQHEIQEWFNHMVDSNTKDYVKFRDYVMMKLLYAGGIRISELINITINDIDENKIWIRCGKGAKDRVVLINSCTLQLIDRYIDLWRNQINYNKTSVLFLSKYGHKLNRQSVYKRVVKWGRTLKLSWVTPHSFRHAYATHLLQNGMSLPVLQHLLGHKAISSTDRYLHIIGKEMKHTFEKIHPRQSMRNEI